MNDLSIIIGSYNTCSHLDACLNSLTTYSPQCKYDITVVDNGSTDRTHEFMEDHAKQARYPVLLQREPEAGLSRARNVGLQAATGDLMLFTDDDCYLDRGYIPLAVRIFESEEFDYGGGQAILQDERDAFVGYNLFEKRKTLKPGRFIPAGSIQGSSMILRRRVIEEVGLFDCMLGAGTPFPCEDIDYVARASFAGFTGGKFPELVVRHDHGRRPGSEYLDTLKAYDHGRGEYYAKYLMEGRICFLFHWIRQSSFEAERSIFNEFTAACRYVVMRIRG